MHPFDIFAVGEREEKITFRAEVWINERGALVGGEGADFRSEISCAPLGFFQSSAREIN